MSLINRDKEIIWHPLTQHKTAADPIGLVKAEGALLFDEDGNQYIDGIASWYTAMYGHCNDYIINAVTEQMKTLDQVVFTGFTHEPAVRLAEMLLNILPANQSRIFFNDNGSTAVEAAIKMAIQYHHNRGETRDTLIAFENAFHGDTFGAMSTSDLSVYNGPFESFLLKVEHIPAPNRANAEQVLQSFQNLLEAGNCSAFVYEPLVQGAAGMKFHDGELLNKMIELARTYGVISIADEVMTGFGKTGKHFASDHLTHKPDIICLSKALTAGMIPMGITSCTEKVFKEFLDNEISKGFFHAHTYSANPPACAAAMAGIDLLTSEEIKNAIANICTSHQAFAKRIENHKSVKDLRVMGVIFAFELDLEMSRYGDLRNRIFDYLMKQGVFLRPLGNTIYILPPYTIKKKELQKIYDVLEELIVAYIPSLLNE